MQPADTWWLAVGRLNSLICFGAVLVTLAMFFLVGTQTSDTLSRTQWIIAVFACLLLLGQLAKLTRSALAPAFTALVLAVAVLWILATSSHAFYTMDTRRSVPEVFFPAIVIGSYLAASAILDIRIATLWHRRSAESQDEENYQPPEATP